jgi:hypothetical protein
VRNEGNNESKMNYIILNCDSVRMKNRQLTTNTNQMERALRMRSVAIQNMFSTGHIKTKQEKNVKD